MIDSSLFLSLSSLSPPYLLVRITLTYPVDMTSVGRIPLARLLLYVIDSQVITGHMLHLFLDVESGCIVKRNGFEGDFPGI